MLREIIQSQLPLLIIICLLTYLVYYLHKRILRIETYLKKLNENQLLQQKGIETTQTQVAQVAQAVEPVITRPAPVAEPVIPERPSPMMQEPQVQQSTSHVEEEMTDALPANHLFNIFAALQQEMNNARQQSQSKIEEINESGDEEDDGSDDEDDDSGEDDESASSEKNQVVMDEIESDDESHSSSHHEEPAHEDEKPVSKKNFNKMTVKELQAIGIENGLNVMKKTRKELIAMLEEKANSS